MLGAVGLLGFVVVYFSYILSDKRGDFVLSEWLGKYAEKVRAKYPETADYTDYEAVSWALDRFLSLIDVEHEGVN